ncbi:PKD domain-containing protein [Singulisphaera sp. PoT]|uniref:PKD domain-containing protein n=1 Tax=Singulisphaera sp. PoT TaxID=3411797 RepID=UPI003BF568FA
MSRKRPRQDDRRVLLRNRRELLLEALECRDLPAGGLASQVLDASTVRIDPGQNQVDFSGSTAADSQSLINFFNVPDGQAGSASFRGSMSVGGEQIQGAFWLTENGANSGVKVVVAQASMVFGSGQGVAILGATGAFELLSTGAAGVLKAGSSADSLGIVGVDGLAIGDTPDGLSFEVNQTGHAIHQQISTANGDVAIDFNDGASVLRLAGAVDFKVAGDSGTLARVGGDFTMTRGEDDGLVIAGEQVTVDFYAGGTRAVTLGSASADFTLDAAGFSLADDSFTVSAFAFLPAGQPVGADEGNYTSEAMKASATLGPIALVNVSPVLAGLSFGPGGFNVNVGVSADSASLTFQKAGTTPDSGDAPLGATATTLVGTFAIAGDVDPATGRVTSFSVPGAFSFHADTFDLTIPRILEASAEDLTITYDPGQEGSQQILTAGAVAVTVPALKLTGKLASDDEDEPALVVDSDGFSFARGTVTYNGDVQIGANITVTNPSVTLGGFAFSNTAGVTLGSFAVGADGLSVGGEQSKVKVTGTRVSAEVGFDAAGAPNSFTLKADSITAKVGSLITFAGTGVVFDPTASGSDPVLALASASASVAIDKVGLTLTGSASDLSIGADGSVLGPSTLSIEADFDSGTGSKLGLPSYLPFHLQSLGLDWSDFAAEPSHFTIDVSASVKGTYGPVSLSGSVDSMVIDPEKLEDGEFPIVGLSGFSVSAAGDLFGGTVSGTVIAGLIKLDALGNVMPDDSIDFSSTVFYGGIKGAFDFAGIGASIAVGFSEKGLLSAYLSADVPVILDPTSGLALTDFRGGISFNATPLPVPTDPGQLKSPIFKPTARLTAEQWQDQLKQQVVNQVSGGSRIFSVVLDQDAVIDELNSGAVAIGGATDHAFSSQGYTVTGTSDETKATTLTAGSLWMVEFQGSTYFVRKNDAGNLDVSQARFTASNSLAGDLGGGQSTPAPASLIALFKDHDVSLSTSATVSDIQDIGGAPSQWKVVDGSTTFYVARWGTGSSAVLAVTGGDGASVDEADQVMRIEAGATLYDAYASQYAFKADVDIIITTDGKFLINGAMTLANSVSADVKIFGDLSSIGAKHPNAPLTLMMLADLPGGDEGTTSAVELKGTMTFSFRNAAGDLVNPAFSSWTAFEFNLLGQATVGSPDTAALVFGGSAGNSGGYAQVKLTVTNDADDTQVRLDVSGSVSIAGVIQAGDLVTAAGTLILDKPAGGALEFYGAVELNFDSNSPGLSFLRSAGLSAANADLLLAVNTSSTSKQLSLTLPGRETEDLSLAPETLELDGKGTLQFANSVLGIGANVSFDGAFAAKISDEAAQGSADHSIDLDLFVDGQLQITLGAGGQQFNLLNLEALGLIAVRGIDITKLVDGKPVVPQLAARIDLTLQRGVPGLLEESGSMELLVNTTGRDFTYYVPERLVDTINALEAHKEGVPPGTVTLPPLPALIGPDGVPVPTVTVPAAPPAIKGGSVLAPGPYFALQFGDPGDSISPGSGDTNGNGLINVHLGILSTFDLYGSFRIVAGVNGFQMNVDATATLKAPGAGRILDAEATGVLNIGPDGFFGALGFETQLSLPGTSTNFANATFAIGLNTTSQPQTLDFSDPKLVDQTIAAHTGQVYAAGSLAFGGLSIAGHFELLVGAQSLQLEVDGNISVANVPALHVAGTATLYYGQANSANNGLVFHVGLGLGDGGTIGVAGVFEVGGTLTLDVDTRASSYNVHIKVDNASLNLLDVFTLNGSADVAFGRVNNQPTFDISGSFSGNLFNVFNVNGSGSFHSTGDFDLNLSSNFTLGSDDYGIRGGASLYIDKSDKSLAFGGSAYGDVRAFGVTLAGANVGLGYDSSKGGKITAHTTVTVIGISKSVDFTVGYLVLNAQAAPNLGSMDGGALNLYVGSASAGRAVGKGEVNEDFRVDTIGRGSLFGEKVQVQAFGSVEVFDNVTSINGDFGTGSDSLSIGSSVGTYDPGLAIHIKGEGNSQFINESATDVTFDVSGSTGYNVLQTQGGDSTLFGGAGIDFLSASGGNNTIWGGTGIETINWTTGDGTLIVHGGGGTNDLEINGTASAESYQFGKGTSLGGVTPITIGVSANGTSAGTITAYNIRSITVNGRGSSDTVSLSTDDLNAAGVTSLALNLGQMEGSSSNPNAPAIDDGSADSITIVGSTNADAFTVGSTRTDDVQVVSGPLTVLDRRPGKGDQLAIRGNGGDDQFTVEEPDDGEKAVSRLVQVTLDGQGAGNSVFNLPVGEAVIRGSGSSAANLFVNSGDPTTLTLTSQQLYSSSASTALNGIKDVSITASTAVGLTVQSTLAGSTQLTLASGSHLDVQSTSGPLDVTLQGNADARLDTTGASATIKGTTGAGSSVVVGSGLLSRLGNVAISNVDSVSYDDSLDNTGRTVTLNATGLSVGSFSQQWRHSGASSIVFLGGLGNDTINANVGVAALNVVGGGGSDTLNVNLSGDPSAISPINSARPLVMAGAGVEAVNFANSSNSASTSWGIDNAVISAGTLQVLDASGVSGLFAARLGNSNQSVRVQRVSIPTSINLGSGKNTLSVGGTYGAFTSGLDDVARALTFTAAGTQNSLVLDDWNSATSESRSISDGVVTGTKPFGAIDYSGAGVNNLTVNLGSQANTLALGNLPATTTVNGNVNNRDGYGNATIIGSGTLNNLTFQAYGGNNTLTLTPGTKTSTVAFLDQHGPSVNVGTNSLVVDGSAATSSLSGSLSYLSSTQAKLSLGQLAVALNTTNDIGTLNVSLGAFNDAFSIDVADRGPGATFTPQFVNVNGGPGDDSFTVSGVNGAVSSYKLNGGDGNDTATVVVNTPPMAGGLFTAINPNVESLVINGLNGDANNPANTNNWSVSNSAVAVNGYTLIDSTGAGRVTVKGDTSGWDTLSISGNGQPVNALIDGSLVTLTQGTAVLTQSQTAPLSPTPVTGNITGLAGAQWVVSTPSGSFVYAAGASTEGVAVFKRAASTGLLSYVTTVALPGNLPPSALAITPDGSQLLVGQNNGTSGSTLLVYPVDATTGLLLSSTSFSSTGDIGQVVVSPDGRTVLLVPATDIPNTTSRLALVLTRDPSSKVISSGGGYLMGIPGGTGRVSFSADSTQLYVPSTSKGTVTIFTNEPGYYQQQFEVGAQALAIGTGNQVQVGAGGKLLFVYNKAQQTLDYYALSKTNDPTQIVKLGTITGVSNATPTRGTNPGKAFAYDDSTGVLVTLFNGDTSASPATFSSMTAYTFDSSSGTFRQASTVSLQYRHPQSLAVGDGSVVISSPVDDNTSSDFDAFSLSSSGQLGSPSKAVLSYTGTWTFQAPVAVIGQSSTSAPDVYLAVEKEANSGNAYYVLFRPGNQGALIDDISSYQLAANTTVLDMAVPRQFGKFMSVVFALEDSPAGRALAVYSVEPPGPNHAQQTLVRIGYTPLSGNLTSMDRIKLSPDSETLYLTNASGGMTGAYIYPANDAYGPSINPDDLASNYKNTSTLGFAASDLAFNGTMAFGVSSTTNSLALLKPAGHTLDGSQTRVLQNGYRAVDLTGASAAASSADNKTLFVATQGGRLVSVAVDVDRDTAVSLGTLSYASPVSGKNNGTDLIRTGTNGDQILISSEGDSTIYRVALTGANGGPISQTIPTQKVVVDSGPRDLTLVGGDLYIACSSADGVAALTFNGSILGSATFQRVAQGQSFTLALSGLQAVATTPDGRFIYGVSPGDGAVAIFDKVQGTWASYITNFNFASGLVGASMVAATSSNGKDLGFVMAPGSNVLTIFSGSTYLGQTSLKDFTSGATAITTSSDGKTIYVAVDKSIYAYDVASIINSKNEVAASIKSSNKASFNALANSSVLAYNKGSLYAFSNGATPTLFAFSSNLGSYNSVTGLVSVSGLAFYGSDIYASSSSALGTLYHVAIGSKGALTLLGDTSTNGRAGVQGLDGASSVAVSSDGNFVFVASATGNSVAAFSRDTSTGRLTFQQLVRDSRGANGLTSPTGLISDGKSLIVASGAGRSGGRGGIAYLDILQGAIPTPAQYLTSFQNMSKLTVNGGGGADTFQVRYATGGTPLVVNGGGGGDLVSLYDLGGGSNSTTVNFDSGNSELDVNQTVAQSSAGALTVNGGSGPLMVNIQSLGTGSNATINLGGSQQKVDVVNVVGSRLPATSSVAVYGSVATTSNGKVYGPVLIDNGPGSLPAAGTSGSIRPAGYGAISFNDLNNGVGTQQVFVLTSPNPSITISPLVSGNPIAEGNGVTLIATDQANLPGDSFAWDLNGDGQFTDAFGPIVNLSWAQLQSLGINNRGSYPVAVQVTTTQNPVQYSGQVFQASAYASSVLTIADTPPTVQAPGGSAIVGVPFSIDLKFSEPGTDPVTSWVVNWGDGTTTTYDASASTASHIYNKPDSYATAKVTAYQGALATSSVLGTITAAAGQGTVTLVSPSSLIAGNRLTATATAPGSPNYAWILTGPGGSTTLNGSTSNLDVSFSSLNISAAGTYSLSVTASYGPGADKTASMSNSLLIISIAPTGVLNVSTPTVPQGSASGAITLSVGSIIDPAPGNANPTYLVRYIINGMAVPGGQDIPASQPLAVPASFLATPGVASIRADLVAPDGMLTVLQAAYTVTPVAPTLSLTTPNPIDEGGIATFMATVAGPGASVISWLVTWGDGSVTSLAGSGGLSQAFSHVYGDNLPNNAAYPITVTATTNGGDVIQSSQSAVNNVAPSVSLSTMTSTVTEGVANEFVLNVSVNQPGTAAILSYTVDWGDGSSPTTVSGDVKMLTHTYARMASPGATFPISVTSITNSDGTYANPSNTLSVDVLNAPPVIATGLWQVPSIGSEGQPLRFGAVATSLQMGIKPLTFTWTVTGPDGQPVTLPATDASQPYLADSSLLIGYQYATSNSNAYTPLVPGNYTVALVVKDDEGGQASYSQTVQVQVVSPTITSFVVPTTGSAFQPISLSASAEKPAGLVEPLAYTWTVTEQNTGHVQTLTGATPGFTPKYGAYLVQLSATDDYGGSATKSATIRVVNPGPSIPAGALVVPTTGIEGGQATFSVSAIDPDPNSTFTYTWQVVDPNGNLSRFEGVPVSYTYTIPGKYTVSVTATDSIGLTARTSATVDVANVAPTIISAIIPPRTPEGSPVTFSATATDPGGSKDPLSYTWTITGPDKSVSFLVGDAPTFTPPDHGSYSVSLTVTDSFGGIGSKVLGTILVDDVPPTLGAIKVPAGPIAEGQSVTLTVPLAGTVPAELPTIRYDWTVLSPDGSLQTFNDQGTSLPFTFRAGGDYTITATATEKDGLASSPSRVTLSVADIAPTITGWTIPTGGYVGFPLNLEGAATDVPDDADKLAYTWTITPPSGPAQTLTGSKLTYSPSVAGSYGVTLTVTDPEGESTSRTGSILVSASPVSITSFRLPTGSMEASRVNLSAAAFDALGGAVTYTWNVKGTDGRPLPVSGNGTNISFVPPIYGNYSVTLIASTPNGQAAASGTLAVADVAPVIQRMSLPDSSTMDTPVVLSALAIDVGGAAESLTYTWTIVSPDGTPFATLAGPQVTFTPAELGNYGVRLVVSDGAGGQDRASGLLPVLDSPPHASAGGPYTVNAGGTVTLDALSGSFDVDQPASTLTYAWDFKGTGEFNDATGPSPTFSALNLDGSATVTVRVRVTDAAGASDIASATIEVLNVAPTITSLLPIVSSLNEGSGVSVSGTFADPGSNQPHTGLHRLGRWIAPDLG